MSEDDNLHRRVLAKSFVVLIENLDPSRILDHLLVENILSFSQVDEIQAMKTSSEKARKIVENVRSRGMGEYVRFKRILHRTGHIYLMEYLQQQEFKMTSSPPQTAILTEIPTEKDLLTIAQSIGSNWEILAAILIENHAIVDQIKMDNHTAFMQIYRLLIKWKQAEGPFGTFGKLLYLMQKADTVVAIDWDSIAEYLKIKPADIRACKDNYPSSVERNESFSDSAVPDEVASDPRTLQLYEAAIREGKERDRNMRVMVVGCYGQGKSSLVRHLTGQSLEGVESTNGIEVQICESILDTQELWTIKYLGDARLESMKRLATVGRLIQNQSLETKEHTRYSVTSGYSDTHVAQKTTTVNDKLAHQIDEKESKSEMEDGVQSRPGRVLTMDSLEFIKEMKNDKEKENKLQEKTLEINIWDFGGQFVYYATHQLFHSRQAIYILVFDIAKGLDVNVFDKECPNEDKERSMEEYLKFWIRSVHSFVGNEEGTEPPIFLVGTHLDMLDENIDQDGRFEDVRQLFDDTVCAFHIQPQHFAVSNTNPNQATFAEIRRAITAYALKKSVGLFIPAKWIPLERSLKENRHLKIITFEKVKEFDRSNDIPIGSEDQLKLFLHYHHEKGTFFYFENETDAINHVVLDPQFLIDAFRCIITADRFRLVHQNLRKLWQKLRNEAVLEIELLDELWKKESDKEFMKFKKPLLFFLQKHRIIAEALAFDEASSTLVPQNFYIVPSLLKKTSEGMIDDFVKEKKYTNVSIGYNFEYVSTLCTVYNRVIAAVLGKWPILKFKSTSLVYENAVVCKLNISHSGILKRLENSLELLVVSLCPEEDVSAKDCDAFRRFVEMVIQDELHKFQTKEFEHQRRGYREIVRCYDKDHGYSGSCEAYELDTLQTYNKDIIGCPDHLSHSISIRDIRTEWFNADIVNADVPQRTLSEKELSKLSTSIGNNWEHLARMLGFSDAEIEQVCMDKITTSARIYEILRRWNVGQLDGATLDVLISAILECGKSLTVNKDVLKNLIDGTLLSRQY